MTKIGEGQTPAEQPNLSSYKQDLETNSTKFLQSLEQYNQSRSGEEQAHLRTVMDQQMALIQASVRELKKHGFHKEAEIVVKDYKDYKDEETPTNYLSLHNDVETLRDLNRSS